MSADQTSPVLVLEQIAILLALIADLFDSVPLDKMAEAPATPDSREKALTKL